MEVTFTKLAGRRYLMRVTREHGPALAPRQGPGYDDYLPHDAVHLIVESEAGLTGGVFGRIAAGQSNIFTAADPSEARRQRRREAKRRPTTAQSADMARSELLASVCGPLWELRSGRRAELPLWLSPATTRLLDPFQTRRILERLDDFAVRWFQLPIGGSMVVTWRPRGRAGPLGTGQRR